MLATELKFLLRWLNKKGIYHYVNSPKSMECYTVVKVLNLSGNDFTFNFDDCGELINMGDDCATMQLFANDNYLSVIGIDLDNKQIAHVYGYANHHLFTTAI